MSLPCENATSGASALDDIHKVLTRFGCARFGTMTDNEKGELLVQEWNTRVYPPEVQAAIQRDTPKKPIDRERIYVV